MNNSRVKSGFAAAILTLLKVFFLLCPRWTKKKKNWAAQIPFWSIYCSTYANCTVLRNFEEDPVCMNQ